MNCFLPQGFSIGCSSSASSQKAIGELDLKKLELTLYAIKFISLVELLNDNHELAISHFFTHMSHHWNLNVCSSFNNVGMTHLNGKDNVTLTSLLHVSQATISNKRGTSWLLRRMAITSNFSAPVYFQLDPCRVLSTISTPAPGENLNGWYFIKIQWNNNGSMRHHVSQPSYMQFVMSLSNKAKGN